MSKKELRFTYLFDDDGLEGVDEISVYPENNESYHSPDVGDQITIPEETDDTYTIEVVTQMEDEPRFDLKLDRPLEQEFPEGTKLYVKPG